MTPQRLKQPIPVESRRANPAKGLRSPYTMLSSKVLHSGSEGFHSEQAISPVPPLSGDQEYPRLKEVAAGNCALHHQLLH